MCTLFQFEKTGLVVLSVFLSDLIAYMVAILLLLSCCLPAAPLHDDAKHTFANWKSSGHSSCPDLEQALPAPPSVAPGGSNVQLSKLDSPEAASIKPGLSCFLPVHNSCGNMNRGVLAVIYIYIVPFQGFSS